MTAIRRGAYALFLALAGTLLPGCLIEPLDGESCWAASGCNGCLERSGCGWCADGPLAGSSEGSCMPGHTLRPADGLSCSPANWYFRSCDQAAPRDGCARNSFCSTCTDDDRCGWCPETGTCVERGAADGCALVRDGESCSGATCAGATSCGDCHARGCTWCDDGSGRDGNGRCIDYGRASCATDGQTYRRPDSCPPPNRCAGAASCGDCLEMPDCGWCDTGDSWSRESQCLVWTASSSCIDEWVTGESWVCG